MINVVKPGLISLLTIFSCSVLANNPAPVTEIGSGSRVSALQRPAGTLDERLSALERVVEARAEAQIIMQQQLHSLLDEVSELRGVTETHTYQLEEIIQRQRDLYQEIDRRMSAIQQSPVTPTAADAAATNLPAVSYSSNLSENDAYDKAVNMVLKDRRYDAAIPEFESFLRNYPNSVYASNSHYWLGQLLFNKNELTQAKTHFERVVNNFPDSNKVPDALLKLGQAAERENDKAAALSFYRKLVSSHAATTSAKLAQERIEALR